MGDLRSLVIEYFAAQDAKRCAADLRDGVPPHHSHRGEPWDSAYLLACERAHAADVALRAAVATPPDTGWRDRAPTEAEVRAHRRGHPDEHTSMAGLWMYQPTEGMLQVWALYGSPDDAPGRWRPLTASGDPCAWPEVTP